MTFLLLLVAFVLIVVGAIGFTNAVEWLGHRLELGTGAVGGLLAAVGTALPESLIPLVAVISGGGKEGEEVAIGAIIGAPFLLGTLAMLLIAGSAHGFRQRRGDRADRVEPHQASVRRDLWFFLGAFPIGIVVGMLDAPIGVRAAVGVVLLVIYGAYVKFSLQDSGEEQSEEDLKHLWLDRTPEDPPSRLEIGIQLAVSLAAIIGGAELFVTEVEQLSKDLGIGLLIISLVLAPLASELPEKANSVLWMREGKDELALGNVTGAMVFQATVPVTLGLVLTDWDLSDLAVAAAATGLLGGVVAAVAVRRRHFGWVPSLAWVALLAGFAAFAATA